MGNPRIAEEARKAGVQWGPNNPSPNPGHTKKHPNGYLTPILKKLLNKTMKIQDEEVQKVFGLRGPDKKAALKKVIMLRYILNAVEGENPAIEGILDRIDGKLKANGDQPLIDQSKHYHFTKLDDKSLINEIRKTESDLLGTIERGTAE